MIPVEIFTPSQRLRGTLNTKHHRVVDALNAAVETAVVLNEVEMTQLTGSLQYVQHLAVVKLSKRAISFAVPQEGESEDPLRRQQRLFAFQPKEAYPVLLCLENFEVRGNVHMPRAGSAVQARDILELAATDFVPITEATIVFLLKPTLAF